MEIYQQDFLVEEEDDDDSLTSYSIDENNDNNIENILFEEIEFELSSILTVLKCSVHTLQLAVHDTMKNLSL